MGSPGRKPKNPHLKLVDGNPGKRPIPETIPVIAVASIKDIAEPDWKEWFPPQPKPSMEAFPEMFDEKGDQESVTRRVAAEHRYNWALEVWRDRSRHLARARKVASHEWRRIAPELIRYKLLTVLDLAGLADYCVCVARIDQSERVLSAEGLTVIGERGIVRHPIATVLNQYRTAVKVYASEFGLGLSSRGRLKLPVTPDDEPGADLLD